MSAFEVDEVLGETESFTDEAPQATPLARVHGVVTGTLIGFIEQGRTPLVLYPGQAGTGAIAASTIVDLHAAHIGRNVVLMFDGGDMHRPIVMGWLRHGEGWPLPERPGHVEVHADGERLMVSAKEQLVLRCGQANITLTCDGRIVIRGRSVVSHAEGVNRIRGGSVQLN